eukprot:SM000093S24428  [mRNA]  locus=s93:361603:365424:+ [translate_table: standard]
MANGGRERRSPGKRATDGARRSGGRGHAAVEGTPAAPMARHDVEVAPPTAAADSWLRMTPRAAPGGADEVATAHPARVPWLSASAGTKAAAVAAATNPWSMCSPAVPSGGGGNHHHYFDGGGGGRPEFAYSLLPPAMAASAKAVAATTGLRQQPTAVACAMADRDWLSVARPPAELGKDWLAVAAAGHNGNGSGFGNRDSGRSAGPVGMPLPPPSLLPPPQPPALAALHGLPSNGGSIGSCGAAEAAPGLPRAAKLLPAAANELPTGWCSGGEPPLPPVQPPPLPLFGEQTGLEAARPRGCERDLHVEGQGLDAAPLSSVGEAMPGSLQQQAALIWQAKHALQQAAILGHMEAAGLLSSPADAPRALPGAGSGGAQIGQHDHLEDEVTAGDSESAGCAAAAERGPVTVEFGAGRGYLALMLCIGYGRADAVLVDRGAFKFKADRTFRKSAELRLDRLRVDIRDLDLAGVPLLAGRKFVAVSKHLCGPATDFALRCCLKGSRQEAATVATNCNQTSQSVKLVKEGGGPRAEKVPPGPPELQGLAIATCCHHLCDWRSYINKQFFRSLGFSRRDFRCIVWLTSWALSGHGPKQAAPASPASGWTASDPALVTAAATADPSAARPASATNATTPRDLLSEAQLSAASLAPMEPNGGKHDHSMHSLDVIPQDRRLSIGRACKQLIDTGRLQFLRNHGLAADIVAYIPTAISPENRLLLATYQADAL